jgi:hypothetical protein
MANPFEDQARAEQQTNDLYRKLVLKIHPDKFPVGEYGKDINQKADELTRDIDEIKNGRNKKVGSGRTIVETWTGRLRALEEKEEEIEEFIKRAKEVAEERKKSGANTGNSNEKMTSKKFREQFGDFFIRPSFDHEFNSFYVLDYDENSGQIKIKIKINGNKDFEEKIIDSVGDFNDFVKKITRDKTSTIKEYFKINGADNQKKQKENMSRADFEARFGAHQDFINKNASYFDLDDNEIRFSDYNEKTEKVYIYNSSYAGGKRKKGISPDEFEELLKKCTTEKKEKTRSGSSDVTDEEWEKRLKEKEEAAKAASKSTKEDEKQAENDIAAEYEMGDKIKADKDKDKDKENDEAAEYEMGDRITEEKVRSGKADRIKEELETARKEYLEMDYKKRGMWDRMNRFFGKRMVKEEGYTNKLEEVSYKTGENGNKIVDDQDVVYMRALYENKLIDYKNALLKDAKDNGKSNEELGNILKIITIETTAKLAEVHDQVRVEHIDGKAAGVIEKSLKSFNEWYKKQPLKYKIAVGAGLGVAGFGAGFYGLATAATWIGYTAVGRRIAMGVVAGTGSTMWLEKKTQARRESGAEKEAQKFVKQTEVLGYNEEEKFAVAKSALNEKIFGVDNSISGIKNKSLRNLFIGGAATAFISSGVAGYVLKELHVGEYIGKGFRKSTEFGRGLFGGHVKHVVPPGGVISPGAVPETPKGAVPKTPSGPKTIPESPKVVPEKPSTVIPEGPKGPSSPLGTAENPYTPSNKIPETLQSPKITPEVKVPEKIIPTPPHETPSGKMPEKIVPKPSVPQEAPSAKMPVTPEGFKGSSVETAKRGDSVWRMVNRQLEARYGSKFSGLDPERKTFIIDHFKDRVSENPNNFGLKNADKIKIGQKIDFKNLFSNNSETDGVFDEAKNLKPEQLENISKNNKTILNWFKKHPGESLTSRKVESILNERPKPGRVGGAVEHNQEAPKGGARALEENKGRIRSPREHYTKGHNPVRITEELGKSQGIHPGRNPVSITEQLGKAEGIHPRHIQINPESIDVNAHPGKFVAHFDGQFKNVAELNNQLDEIHGGDEKIESMSLDEIKSKISDINKNIVKGASEERIKELSGMKSAMEKFLSLRENFGTSLVKIYSEMAKSLYGGDPSIKNLESLRGINAEDYFKKNADGNFQNMVNSIARVKGIGKNFIQPKAGEDMFGWTRRVFAKLLVAKGINIYK